jgi:23S rRNA (uridine2552-2'-O)-methyltransferase
VSRLRDRRHRRDHFHRQAKGEGYAARSVYKLQQLDQRFRLLRSGQRVLDLGCRPGSWMQYAAQRVGQRGFVVGLDRQDLPLPRELAQTCAVVVGDVLEVEARALRDALPDRHRGGCFHLVLSDMAPDTTGIPLTDQARSVELFLRALELARALGCPGSAFVGKVFMGQGYEEALAAVRTHYGRAKTVRPEATRKSSSEVYVVGAGLAQ